MALCVIGRHSNHWATTIAQNIILFKNICIDGSQVPRGQMGTWQKPGTGQWVWKQMATSEERETQSKQGLHCFASRLEEQLEGRVKLISGHCGQRRWPEQRLKPVCPGGSPGKQRKQSAEWKECEQWSRRHAQRSETLILQRRLLFFRLNLGPEVELLRAE